MRELAWMDASRSDLKQMTDDEIRRIYNDMCFDLGCEYTMDSHGNMVVPTRKQRQLIGKYFRGRGLDNG